MNGRLRNGFFQRWKALRDWLKDGKPLWQFVAITGAICCLSYLFPVSYFGLTADLASRVRWAGLFFQFAGLVIVALGLKESRELFNKEPILRAAWNWAARIRYVVIARKPISGELSVQLGSLTLSANLATGTKSSQTIELRVAELERNLDNVRSEVNHQLGALRGETDRRLDEERRERAEHDRKIREQVESAVVGGIQLELSGMFYLILGIVFSTIPDETAALLQRVGL